MGPVSRVKIPDASPFTLYNLPYGIFSEIGKSAGRPGVAIGNNVIDLAGAWEAGLFEGLGIARSVFSAPYLNDFMALGRKTHTAVRERLQEFLRHPAVFPERATRRLLLPMDEIQLHLPVRIGDYTDFYASEPHAVRVGKLFRPDNPLLPNWKSLPVAYHGRASSVVVSGTPVHRPKGQVLTAADSRPQLLPTQALDFELELGCLIGKASQQGEPVPVDSAADYIFGLVLVNDWSARDIQRWEYQPLGPFTSKNFATTISPWVVTWEAIRPFLVAPPQQDPAPLPYLKEACRELPDIELSVAIRLEKGRGKVVTRTRSTYLYWTIAQQIAHHTVTGCNLRVGDLLASGTISGPEEGAQGCLLELTHNGTRPLAFENGLMRSYLEDGDEVVMTGWCERNGMKIGFGEAKGLVVG